MYKLILSLDGGGIKGSATVRFLLHVEERLQCECEKKTIRGQIDIFAGTSTGGLIALALATTKLTMKAIDGLYDLSNAELIFTRNKGWCQWQV